jgi:outer membrane protein assembly factor BamA
MRSPLAHSVVVAVTCLFAGGRFLQAQSIPSGFTITCPPLSELEKQFDHEEQQHSGPKIVVADIVFSGATEVPPSEQREITAAIKQQTSSRDSLVAVTNEVVERVRAAWLDRGYFNVQVTGKARIVSSRPSAQLISVDVHIDEGLRYRLGEITFKNNTRITDLAFLRKSFSDQQ